MAQPIDLDTTLAALQTGLKSISTEEALAIVEAWHERFRGSDLDDDLRQVKEAIANRGHSHTSLSHALINLGATTAAVSLDASDEVAAKIQQIGALLSEAGSTLDRS